IPATPRCSTTAVKASSRQIGSWFSHSTRTARPTPVSNTTPRAYALRTTAFSTSTLFSWDSEVTLTARSHPLARLLPAATALAAFLIIACAALVRMVPLLDGQPGGLYPDEASEGISALRILADPAYRPVFIDENGGREALFAYLVAFTFHFVTGPTVVGIRATSTIVGLAGIAATWPLLRRYGVVAALAGIAWMAGSPWMIATSVLGLRNGLTVAFARPAAAPRLASSDRPGRRFAFLAGFAAGAGLWTYQPLKLTPLLVGAWLLWLRPLHRPLFPHPWAGQFSLAFP